MTYEQLVEHVAHENKISKALAERAVRSTFSAIKEYVLDGGRVVVPRFGSFKTRHMRRKGPLAGNPGKTWERSARVTVAFRPSEKAKDFAL